MTGKSGSESDLLARRVRAAPFAQRLENGPEAAALAGKVVLQPRRVLAVEAPLDHAGCLQILQARRQRVRRDRGERLLEVLKAARALEEQGPQDKDRPPLPDHLEGARDRAPALCVGPRHA